MAEGAERTDAYRFLTSYYVAADRSEEAHALLEKGIETEEENKLDLIYLRARLNRSEGRPEESESLIVEATRLAPDDARTYMVMASYRVRTHAARLAEQAGADGITAHLREGRRHILDADIDALMEFAGSSGATITD